jgi:hypothetical protein
MSNAPKRTVDLDRLEQDIHTLRIDFERFFNGDLEIPPEQFRESVRSQIASLQAATKNPIESFRLGALEARFHSYSELFNRRMRGREIQHGPRPQRAPARPAIDPAAGIVLGAQFDASGVAPLFKHLYRGEKSAAMDLQSFTDYLTKQHELIRARTGCAEVSFRVVEEGGKKKLKAKPVREARA